MTPPNRPAAQDDDAVFSAIYQRTYRRTLAYALRRVREPADAHDVVAETYLVAWRRLDELRQAEAPQAWLYAVAYRVLSNQRRAETRLAELNRQAEARAAADETAIADLAHVAAKREEIEVVAEAMSMLSARDQEILRLVAFEELDHHEIARVLGIRKPLVRSLVYRARRRLERALDAIGSRPDGAAGHNRNGGTGNRAARSADE